MQKIRTFRDLIAWQKSMNLVEKIYILTQQFSEKEQYGLVSQMRRAVISIPSNIAEGYGRKSKNDYLRFLHFSIGSLFEL